MSGDDQLRIDMAQLCEAVENTPDPWFDRPEGFLAKPDFKRNQQKRDSTDQISQGKFFKELIGRMTWNRRFFVLEGTFLKYYTEKSSGKEKGMIDLCAIECIRPSQIQDAPEFSIDLISTTRIYTLAADSREDMVRWALAIHDAIVSLYLSKTAATNDAQKSLIADSPQLDEETIAQRWEAFSCTFDTRQPLLLNIKGVANKDSAATMSNHWVVVSGFERHTDGSMGPAEAGGRIHPMDVIVGVNDSDITELGFSECLATIKNSSWPLTLHFIRDKSCPIVEPSRREGWARIGYDVRKIRRKRYVELKQAELSVFRPTIGGDARSTRESFVMLTNVDVIEKIHDQRCRPDEAFQICLTLKGTRTCPPPFNHSRHRLRPNSPGLISYLNPTQVDSTIRNDGSMEIIGGNVELCFPSERDMERWFGAVIGCLNASTVNIKQQTLLITGSDYFLAATVDDAVVPGSVTTITGSAMLKDELNGIFLERWFEFSTGVLCWRKRDKLTSQESHKTSFSSNIRMVNLLQDKVQEILPILVKDSVDPRARYRLVIKTANTKITIGFAAEDDIMRWLTVITSYTSMYRNSSSTVGQLSSTQASSSSSTDKPQPGVTDLRVQIAASNEEDEFSARDDENSEMLRRAARSTPRKANSLTMSNNNNSGAATLASLALASGGVSNSAVSSLDKLESKMDPAANRFQMSGWMYKLSSRSRHGDNGNRSSGSSSFRRRWFVLSGSVLKYFKTSSQEIATAIIDLSKVRPSQDPNIPETALEIVSAGKSVILVTETEEEHESWLSILSDVLDTFADHASTAVGATGGSEAGDDGKQQVSIAARDAAGVYGRLSGDLTRNTSTTAVDTSSSSSTRPTSLRVSRPRNAQDESGGKHDGTGTVVDDSLHTAGEDEIRRELVMAGYLAKKTNVKLSNWTSWKTRYFALTRSQLVYYEREQDMYDEDANPLGAWCIDQIASVSTSTDPKPPPGHGFCVCISSLATLTTTDQSKPCKEVESSDTTSEQDSGCKTITLEASSDRQAFEWMQAICGVTSRLCLRKSHLSASAVSSLLLQQESPSSVSLVEGSSEDQGNSLGLVWDAGCRYESFVNEDLEEQRQFALRVSTTGGISVADSIASVSAGVNRRRLQVANAMATVTPGATGMDGMSGASASSVGTGSVAMKGQKQTGRLARSPSNAPSMTQIMSEVPTSPKVKSQKSSSHFTTS